MSSFAAVDEILVLIKDDHERQISISAWSGDDPDVPIHVDQPVSVKGTGYRELRGVDRAMTKSGCDCSTGQRQRVSSEDEQIDDNAWVQWYYLCAIRALGGPLCVYE